MPEVFLERDKGKTGKITTLYTKRKAVWFNNLTYLAESPVPGLCRRRNIRGRYMYMPVSRHHPFADEEVLAKAVEVLLDECSRCATVQVTRLENMLPFEFGDCCGEMALLLPDSLSQDSSGGKPLESGVHPCGTEGKDKDRPVSGTRTKKGVPAWRGNPFRTNYF